MAIKFSDLQCREVICVGSGTRLGFVTDILIEIPEGNVCSLVVPAQSRGMGGLLQREDYIIPWNSIRKIGPDIILVETKPEQCRCPRGQWGRRGLGQ